MKVFIVLAAAAALASKYNMYTLHLYIPNQFFINFFDEKIIFVYISLH